MEKSYYPLRYRLDNKDRFLIWYSVPETSEDSDGVVMEANGKVPIFVSLDALLAYAKNKRIALEEGRQAFFDLASIDTWCKRKCSKLKGPTGINCNDFLTAWNLFADMSRSIDGAVDFYPTKTRKIYEKIFWGCNLPAVTPQGKSYIPLWSKSEKEIIRETMAHGLYLFRSSIKLHQASAIKNEVKQRIP